MLSFANGKCIQVIALTIPHHVNSCIALITITKGQHNNAKGTFVVEKVRARILWAVKSLHVCHHLHLCNVGNSTKLKILQKSFSTLEEFLVLGDMYGIAVS